MSANQKPFDMLDATNRMFDVLFKRAGNSPVEGEVVRGMTSGIAQFPAHPLRRTRFTAEMVGGCWRWYFRSYGMLFASGYSPSRYGAIRALLEARADHREAKKKMEEWR